MTASRQQGLAGSAGGALIFDLSFHETCSKDEAGSLCRQLTMSYGANRRAYNPFPLLVLGGVPAEAGGSGLERDGQQEVGAGGAQELLLAMLAKSNWWTTPGVQRTSSATPWTELQGRNAGGGGGGGSGGGGGGGVVYLTADSPNVLADDEPLETVYIIGGTGAQQNPALQQHPHHLHAAAALRGPVHRWQPAVVALRLETQRDPSPEPPDCWPRINRASAEWVVVCCLSCSSAEVLLPPTGIVDRIDKPGLSYRRAGETHPPTQRTIAKRETQARARIYSRTQHTEQTISADYIG